MHLLIPFAASSSPACQQALESLKLPHLEKLLGRLTLTHTDTADESSLTPPHERVHARALGLVARDGCVPWAARQAAQAGLHADLAQQAASNAAWAWITPCHWHVHADYIVMGNPQTQGLEAAPSQTLLAAMRPFFEEDGITLHYAAPTQWLARGEVFRDLATASLDRVAGRDIDAWRPKTAQAAALRRLQNEMQMLLYTHPLNDERAGHGLAPVNSFWVSGTGTLPAGWSEPAPSDLVMPQALREAALAGDWAAWVNAWQQLDATECAALLHALDAGQSVSLSLCGERSALTFNGGRTGLLKKLMSQLGRQPLSSLRDKL
ncbi:MAG: phosphoglycerate mutase [Rhodoferax sp.]|nr:phosphoglycerate mutase [Rhodoferax sp.]